MRSVRCGPATALNRPGQCGPQLAEAGPQDMAHICAQRVHGAARSAQGALRARTVARLMVVH
jgi:hypothetical protein